MVPVADNGPESIAAVALAITISVQHVLGAAKDQILWNALCGGCEPGNPRERVESRGRGPSDVDGG